MFGHDVICTRMGKPSSPRTLPPPPRAAHSTLPVLDLTIPGGMGGKDAIRNLRERDRNIHAIVSSGYSTDPVMAQCTAYGFNAVLPKPYQIRDLIRVVQELCAASFPGVALGREVGLRAGAKSCLRGEWI